MHICGTVFAATGAKRSFKAYVFHPGLTRKRQKQFSATCYSLEIIWDRQNNFGEVLRPRGTGWPKLGEPPGDVGGTAGPGDLKAFLIRESKNPFRQAWLGKNITPGKCHTRKSWHPRAPKIFEATTTNTGFQRNMHSPSHVDYNSALLKCDNEMHVL